MQDSSRLQITEAVEAFINANTWYESKQALEKHQTILLTRSSEVEPVFEELLAQYQDNEAVIRLIKEHRDLLGRCCQEGIETIFAERIRIEVVESFIHAETWGESKQYVCEQANLLLTDAADQVLANLLEQYKEDENACHFLQDRRQLLADCRQLGIEAAFANRLHSEELNFLINEIQQPIQLEQMPRRVEMCRQALALAERESHPELWGALQNWLANSLAQNPLGERAENLEQAIFHYQQALEVRTRDAYPSDWAGTQNNLANAYKNRIRGERAESIEQAIYHFKLALEVYTRDAFPSDWAMVQNNLANAYSERIWGERALNIEQAIGHIQQALLVYTRDAFPIDWADSQNNLAAAYYDRIRGERADNIELAIFHYQQALQVRTDNAFPVEWANSQNNLAAAYYDRIRGERADNVELAIFHYQQALQVRTRDAFPTSWASTQNNLALAYSDRIKGTRAENIEQAIWHYKQALEVRTRDAFPTGWAMSQNNLANTYCERIRGEPAENLEQAIFHFQQALKVYTRHAFPAPWAMSQNNLANVYRDRIKGERAENVEKAIFHYQQALSVYERHAFPIKWATTQNNLTVAYQNRERGQRAENLEQSIGHAQLALEVYQREAFPLDWAMTQNTLALAYTDRIKGELAENLEQAIFHYQQALTVYERHALPTEWAMSQNNLGEAYRHRIQGEPAENLEQAIFHYQQALLVYSHDAFPIHWAGTQNNLAGAYKNRIKGEQEENLKQAIGHGQLALLEYTPLTWPQRCRDVAYALGSWLYNEGYFDWAQQAFTTAHEAVEALRDEIKRSAVKQKLAEENADLYAGLVCCCLYEDDQKTAFEMAAAGKGRAFVDTLASGGFDISDHIARNPALANDWQTYSQLTQEIDNLRLILNSPNEASTKQRLRSEFQTRIKEQSTLWEDLIYKYPNLTATQQAPRLTTEQACQLAADLQATLVEYVEHAGGWSAFVVTKEAIRHVSLEKVDDQFLNQVSKWIKNIENKKRVFFHPRITRKRLTQLYTALIAPLQEQLPPAGEDKRLVIAPFGLLHQLPIGTAQNPDTLSYLFQAYTLSFTPSLAALRASLDRAKQANWSFQPPENPIRACLPALHIAHAGHKEMTSLDPLQKAGQSAAEMAKLFPDLKQLSEEESTLKASRSEVANRDLIHFYCHGIFEPDNPNQSGLLLHDGFLTVQRIITDLDLSHTHLTALAACQSGRVGLTQGEELVGLIQALLIAGSKSVVATLWKVDESPTQALFQHFYRAIKAGHAPAQALTLATQTIRQTKGWEHPYYWAAFQVSGLAH